MNANGLFSLSDHLEQLSKDGDPLEVLDGTEDFEYFHGWLALLQSLDQEGTLKRVMKAFDWRLIQLYVSRSR